MSGKDLQCCGQCVRWMAFVMNVVTLIAGGVTIGIGVWMLVDQMYMAELIGSKLYKASAGIIIACGSFCFLLSIFGCIGAISKSKCLLSVQFSVLTSIFILLIVGAALAFVFLGQKLTKEKVENHMRESMEEYDKDDDIKKAWDETQQKLECCGTEAYAEWIVYADEIPKSCCDDEKCDGKDDYYTEGCFDALNDDLKKNSKVIGWISLGVAVILVLSSIFTCALSREL